MDNPIPRDRAWRPARVVGTGSLPEVFRSVTIPAHSAQWWKKLLAFFGPGYMVAVGYMDPGNWATDLAGGSKFAYSLLFVIFLSNAMAILLQALSAKLGIVSERDLAQACRESYSRPVSYALWILCELAIVACDLAEVLGSAIALQLLFGLPMLAGVLVTVADVLLLLLLQKRNVRWLESVVITLMATIALCFGVQLWWAGPDWLGVAGGLVPTTRLFSEPGMLLVAVGILGATVMPHNLYLHSAIVQTRRFERTDEGRKDAIRWATIDSTIALMVALFINAAILILAAATFHRNGHTDVAEIQQAYQMLSPVLGAPIASTLFAVALLASGQNSTITGTLAGQIVMEGFLDIKLPGWVRRLVTRALAIIPAVVVIAVYGEKGTGSLLILSQVVLSLQLSFAVFPLIRFTSDPKRMGQFANKPATRVAAYTVGCLIAALNVWLLVQTAHQWLS